MPHLSITAYYLQVDTKKILVIKKICRFNPPHRVNMQTNIGKTFLKLIEKHFPKANSFHKIFNRNIQLYLYTGYSIVKKIA